MDSEKSKTVFAPSRLGWAIIVAVILAIVALPSYYFYNQYQKNQTSSQNFNIPSDTQVKILIDQVGKLIELPQNEQPTVATVSDITKLSGQSFFAHAQNGDKVLIYSQAKEAILYRPSINKIITIAPLNLGVNPSPSPLASASPTLGPSASSKPIPVPTSTPTAIPQ